jgi:hypothetical protein
VHANGLHGRIGILSNNAASRLPGGRASLKDDGTTRAR